MTQISAHVSLPFLLLAGLIPLPSLTCARMAPSSHFSSHRPLTTTDPLLANVSATTTTVVTAPPPTLHKRDFSGGGSAGVGILVALVLGVCGFLLLRWHRKRTQYQISSRDQAVRARLNAWRKDATPQQVQKRPPGYVEAVGWKSSQPTDMAGQGTRGGGRLGLTDGSAQELPEYSEVVGGNQSDGAVVELQRPGVVHVR